MTNLTDGMPIKAYHPPYDHSPTLSDSLKHGVLNAAWPPASHPEAIRLQGCVVKHLWPTRFLTGNPPLNSLYAPLLRPGIQSV
jgi:hypothetical protein